VLERVEAEERELGGAVDAADAHDPAFLVEAVVQLIGGDVFGRCSH
jgi:hypothetical protein